MIVGSRMIGFGESEVRVLGCDVKVEWLGGDKRKGEKNLKGGDVEQEHLNRQHRNRSAHLSCSSSTATASARPPS